MKYAMSLDWIFYTIIDVHPSLDDLEQSESIIKYIVDRLTVIIQTLQEEKKK